MRAIQAAALPAQLLPLALALVLWVPVLSCCALHNQMQRLRALTLTLTLQEAAFLQPWQARA